MNKLRALLKLVRWPNLVFIALTQVLVYEYIVKTPEWINVSLGYEDISILILSTVLIAASGYMINDYFDIRIDSINKPDRVILNKIFSRRAMISWHVVFNTIALLLVVKLAWENQLRLILIQLFCITALVFYSISFKRKLFVGNIIVGLLIGFSVLLIGIYEPNFQVLSFEGTHTKLLWLYTLFAFLITLIREIIKDIEDMRGDLAEDCRTVPIVFGIRKTKQLINLIYFLLLGLVVAFIIRLFDDKMWLCIYFIVGVILPSFFLLYKIQQAKRTSDFAQLSSWIKWLTLSGILSMLLIQF